MELDSLKKAQIGDIFSVKTKLGFVYFQYTHRHEKYGSLICVFEPAFIEKCPNPCSLTNAEVSFKTFFPLQKASNDGLVEFIQACDIAEEHKHFPTFRTQAGGQDGSCWLWDGNEEIRLKGRFTKDQLKYSERGIISHPLLVERIESGYKPH